MNRTYFLILIFGILGLFSCEEKKATTNVQKYNGPMMVTENLNVMFSDSGRTKVKFTTARELKYQNEDEVYPKTVYITFYDKDGVEYSSLRGDSGRLIRQENLYKIMGNVFFFNRLQQQSLSTDLLIWSPRNKKIYTDQKFTIKTPLEELHGVGMESDQDFTHYTMKKAKGSFSINTEGSEADNAVDTTSN